jgi:microcystin degradation protein MlrC
MRVGVIVLKHESNTFLPGRTTLADFQREILVVGDVVRDHYRNAHHEAAGFFEGLKDEKIEAVPIFAATATAGPTIEQSAFDALQQMLLDQISRASALDGLLLSAHGAAVAEGEPDADGHWLAKLRAAVGAQVPIVCTIDPHANLSPAMVGATDVLIPYRTNPHIDQKERGLEAAALMARTLRGEIHPTQAAAFPPVAINIASQHTGTPPCSELIALAADQRRRAGVLSSGVVLGFPYADVAEMGSSFVVVTDNDRTLAQRLADELGNYLLRHRHNFVPDLPDIEAAISLAEGSASPVCLLDLGDNVGGGAPGDGTLIAQALLNRRIQDALVCLRDAIAVEQASLSGVGATIDLSVGGKTDALHGLPLALCGRVRSLHHGRFSESDIRHGGKHEYDMGASAVIEAGGLTVLIHSLRTPPFSLNQILSCGIDPAKMKIIVAKGVNAPLAAYAPVCKTFIRVNTPGVTTADMTRLPFRNRRRPLFPFEEPVILERFSF